MLRCLLRRFFRGNIFTHIFHEMNRDETWQHLIEADANARYFSHICEVCKLINKLVQLTLFLASLGSLVSAIAQNKYQIWLTSISFIAAFIEIILKPVLQWNEVEKQACQWKKSWIEVRFDFEDLWRKNFASKEEGFIDASKQLDKIKAIEMSEGHVPTFQWLYDAKIAKAERARGVRI
jgi:hypothetical protein